jgi:hypothetical protein
MTNPRANASQTLRARYSQVKSVQRNTDLTFKQAWAKHREKYAHLRFLKNRPYYGRALSQDKDELYLDSFEDMPGYITEPKDADKCCHMDHTGWYTDDFSNGTIIGVVVSFRHPQDINPDNESHIFYMAGTKHSDWDGVTVYTRHTYQTEREAARRADKIAEREAEECREEDQKYHAEQKIEELKTEYHELNVKALEVIKDARNASGLFPASICELIKNKLDETLERKRDILRGVKELTDSPWMISDWR